MSEKIGLGSRRIRSALSLLTALLLVGSISYLGVHTYRSSHASSSPTIYASPSSASILTGSTLSVTLREDSGSAPVNSVQASLNYDSDKLQFVSINESDTFPVKAATSTSSPGVIRVGRANADREVTGDNAIVTVNFKVIGSGTGTISIDKSYSFLVSSTNNKDILENVGGGSYVATAPPVAPVPPPASPPPVATTPMPVANPATDTKPVLTLNPASGTVAPGATLSVGVRLNSYAVGVTTVQAVVAYPTNQLEYTGVSEGGAYPIKMRTSASSGSVDIIRAISGGESGLTGDNPVVTLNFKVIGSNGSVPLTLSATSAAYDSSGSGQNILNKADSKGATFTIVASGSTSLAPPAVSNTGDKKAQSSYFASPTQALSIGFRSGSGQASMSTGDDGAALTELGGEVELKPILDPAIFAANPDASLSKVEYYLNGKLIATAKTAPYSHKFDTKTMRNGTYTMAVKSYYNSGIVDTRTDKLKVSNKVTLAYVMRHYLVSTVAVLALLAALVLVILKLVLPRLSRTTDTAQAVDHDVMYGFSSDNRYGDEGPVADDPLLVAPSASPGGDIAPSASSSLLPQFSNAAQTTEALPGTQVVPTTTSTVASTPIPATVISPNPTVTSTPKPSIAPAASTVANNTLRATTEAPKLTLQHQPLNPPTPYMPPRPDITPPAAPVSRTINITTPGDAPRPTAASRSIAVTAAPQKYASIVTSSPVHDTPTSRPAPRINLTQPQS